MDVGSPLLSSMIVEDSSSLLLLLGLVPILVDILVNVRQSSDDACAQSAPINVHVRAVVPSTTDDQTTRYQVCLTHIIIIILSNYTVSQKKNKQNYSCYNYVKLPQNLTIFGKKMTNSLKSYEIHSFSTSTNSRQC